MVASASIPSRITQRGRPGGWTMIVGLLSATLNLPACSGNGSPAPQIEQRFSTLDQALNPHASSCLTMSCIYITNDPNGIHDPGDSYVAAYAAGAKGNVAPLQMIRGPKTGLRFPSGIALDAGGEIYVANVSLPPRLLVFAAGANGNVAPVRTITGPRTGLKFPRGIALDSNGNIYVADLESESSASGSVAVFAAGASGNVPPLRKIIGNQTRLSFPFGIALDGSGNMYVANSSQFSSVTVYAAGANGNAKPQSVIFGDKTQLNNAVGIALDAANRIYVGNGSGDKVNVYAAAANGNVAPIRVIAGPETKLRLPLGIALDAGGKLYVADSNDGNPRFKSFLTVYASGAKGDVPPIQTITGSNTEVESPLGIAIH